jgi:hypothetical protein
MLKAFDNQCGLPFVRSNAFRLVKLFLINENFWLINNNFLFLSVLLSLIFMLLSVLQTFLSQMLRHNKLECCQCHHLQPNATFFLKGLSLMFLTIKLGSYPHPKTKF